MQPQELDPIFKILSIAVARTIFVIGGLSVWYAYKKSLQKDRDKAIKYYAMTDGHDTEIKNLRIKYGSMSDQFQTLKDHVTEKITALDRRMDGVDNRMEAFELRLDKICQSQTRETIGIKNHTLKENKFLLESIASLMGKKISNGIKEHYKNSKIANGR